MTLDELPLNRLARLRAGHAGSTAVFLRLMEMGLVGGAAVEVRHRAPFGGPLQLEVDGYLLSIRRAEARAVSVDIVEPSSCASDERPSQVGLAPGASREAA